MTRVSSHRRGRRRIAACLLALSTTLAFAACADEHTPLDPTATAAANLESIAFLKGDRVVSVDVMPSHVSSVVGVTTTLSATPLDAKGNPLTDRPITWAISDTTIAQLSSGGMVTALAAGTATITATSEGKSGGAALTVTAPVTAPPPSGGVSCGVTDWNPRAQGALAKPGYLQSVTDPVFGTRITRITGDPGTPVGNGVAGTWPDVAYHYYAKDQVWSADQRLMVLKQMKGTGFALFLDGDTYQPLFTRPGPPGGGEWRWHPTLPDVVVYANLNGTVGHWNVRTNVGTTVMSVSGYSNVRIGPDEGNLSNDGRYLAVAATRSSDGKAVAFALDLESRVKHADIDLAAHGVAPLDWVSVTPLGTRVHVLGTINGVGQRSRLFTLQGAPASDWTDLGIAHADLGVDAGGAEVIFGAARSGTYNNRFVTRAHASGATTAVQPPSGWFDYHVSARNLARPGWGYGSINNVTGNPLDGQLFALKLDGSMGVERYAHHRNTNTDYDATPFAVPSRDGRRVVFASNWGGAGGRPVQTYVVGCP